VLGLGFPLKPSVSRDTNPNPDPNRNPNPDQGADYNGGRDYEALKSWVEENLEVKCLLDNTEGCSDKEKEFMDKWKAKGKEEVTSQLERLKGNPQPQPQPQPHPKPSPKP